jgi:hypothetical protein
VRGKRGYPVDADADYKWRSRVLVVTAEMGGKRTVRYTRVRDENRTFTFFGRDSAGAGLSWRSEARLSRIHEMRPDAARLKNKAFPRCRTWEQNAPRVS